MRVFQDGVQQTAAVNTHTGIQTQETHLPQHTHFHTVYKSANECINAWLFAYTPAHNPKRSGREFVFMRGQSRPYWREYDMGMCNYMTNVVMI